MRRLDRFCNKYDRYGIRNLIAVIMFGNAAVFFANFINLPVLQFLTFNPALVLQGQVWRLVTFAFVPESLDLWFVFFLMFYFWIGRMLEDQWGRMKFTLFYGSGMLFTILFGFLVHFAIPNAHIALDANYINLTLFLAAATLFPDMQIRLFMVLPIKMKWLGIVYAVVALLPVVMPPYSLLNLLPLVAFGNYIYFFFPQIKNTLGRLGRRLGFKGSSVPNFRILNTRQSDHGPQIRSDKGGYRHKCTICGATELTASDLEFRYCSLCTGAKCYCSKHIFDHEHK